MKDTNYYSYQPLAVEQFKLGPCCMTGRADAGRRRKDIMQRRQRRQHRLPSLAAWKPESRLSFPVVAETADDRLLGRGFFFIPASSRSSSSH